jgi:hypothetical protein
MKPYKKILIALLIVAGLFPACTTQKKQQGKALQYFQNHPGELAEFYASKFPVTYTEGKDTVIRVDTTYLPGDSVPCPEAHLVPSSIPGKDSIVYRDRFLKCPDNKQIDAYHQKTDTAVDNGKLAALQSILDRYKDSTITYRTQRDQAKDQAKKDHKRGNLYLLLFCSLIVLLLAYGYLKIRKILP